IMRFSMDRFRPSCLVFIAALLSVPLFSQDSAQHSAQTTSAQAPDDLPSAPSAVVQQKPAPQKAAPVAPTEEPPASQGQATDPAQRPSDPIPANSDTASD